QKLTGAHHGIVLSGKRPREPGPALPSPLPQATGVDFIEETGRALSRLSASTFRLAEPPLTPPPAHIDIAHEASSNRDTAVGDGPEAKEKKLSDVRYALAEMQHKLLREFLLTVALASGAV